MLTDKFPVNIQYSQYGKCGSIEDKYLFVMARFTACQMFIIIIITSIHIRIYISAYWHIACQCTVFSNHMRVSGTNVGYGHNHHYHHHCCPHHHHPHQYVLKCVQIKCTVAVKSLDTPTHSRDILYFHYFLHCRIIVKTSTLWKNTYGVM